MYFHIVGGTGSYTTSTTNMYHKDFTYRRGAPIPAPTGVAGAARHGATGFFVQDGDALPVPPARFGAHGCRAIFTAPLFRAIARARRLVAIAPRRTIVRAPVQSKSPM